MTPTTAPELTREQDAYAEQLACDHDSVEVRLLHDGVASVTTRTAEPGKLVTKIRLIDEDGVELGILAKQARHEREQQRCIEAMFRLVGCTPAEQVESLRLIVSEAMRPWPQYDGKFDEWVLATAVRRHRGKGGISHEPGDLLLVNPHREQVGFRTVFSLRRLVQVSTDTATFRLVEA
jgi:hypothetical protein